MAEQDRRQERIPQRMGSGGPDNVRASDAEREQIIEQLQQHYVDGRITAEELSERTEHIYASRTRGALAEVLNDLPVLNQPAATSTTARQDRPRRRPPVAAIVFGVIAVLFVLRGLAWAIFGGPGPDGDFDGPPFAFPLIPLLFMWVVIRARRARD